MQRLLIFMIVFITGCHQSSDVLYEAKDFKLQGKGVLLTTRFNSFEEFKTVLSTKGGFVSAHWDGTAASEEAIKKATKATIRCIPYAAKEEEGKCVISGNTSAKRVLFARAY